MFSRNGFAISALLAFALGASSLAAQLINENFEGVTTVPVNPDVATGYNIPSSGWTVNYQFTAARGGAAAQTRGFQITNAAVNAPPAATYGTRWARFVWTPSMSNYSVAMISPNLNASSYTQPELSFTLWNNGFTNLAGEFFEVWVRDNTAGTPTWVQVFQRQQNGSATPVSTPETVNLSAIAGSSNFQIALVAQGANSFDLDEWIVDNLSLVNNVPPANVTITTTALPAGLIGQAYSFTVQATGGTPANYSWGATGLPSPLTINASTGQITGTPASAGSFPVTVNVTDGSTNDSDNFTLFIQRYAAPVYTTGTALNDYIDGVVLNTISNTGTGAQNGPSYTDYSSTHSTTLFRGVQYAATVTGSPGGQQGITIFIDADQNNVFSVAEQVGFGMAPTSSNVVINFTVPATATLGATGIRFRGVYNTAPADPYSSYSWGETEDYEVIIADPPAAAPVLAAPVAPVASSPILITEFTTNTVIDGLEIQNVSGGSFDATGWQVIISDDYTNINAPNTITQTLGVMTAGQAIYWTDGGTNYWGNNIFWDPSGTGWIMLVDAAGNIRDFVAFNWNAAAISGMSVNAGGFTALNPGTEWSGNGITDTGNVFARIGTGDNNNSSDWQDNGGTDSWGTTNAGLTLPFAVSGSFIAVGGTDPNFTGQCVVGDDLEVTFSATDINSGDTLTFTISVDASSTITAAAAGFTQTFPYSPTGGTSPQSVMLTGTAAAVGVLVLNVQVSDGSLTDSYTFTLTINPPPADIDVQRPASTSLGSGTTATDDLGNVPTTGDTFTYTIANVAATGAGNLTLTGTPMVDAPAATQNNCTVTVDLSATSGTVAAQGSTTFDVTVTPTTAAAFSFTLDIASDDPDEPMYTITVSGIGFVPNGAPVVSLGAGNWTNAGGGLFTLTLDPGDAIADDLSVTDPENDDMTVTVTSAPTLGGITTQPSNVAVPTPGPLTLAWAGTADAANNPGSYDWTIEIDDGSDVTTITARIIINDLPPVHAILDASGGDGSVSTPYTTAYTETMTGSAFVDLATLSDPNTSQVLALGTVTNGSSNPAGGAGFTFTVSAGMLTVAPNGTLDANDVGTHTFTVEVTDNGANTIDIEVSIAVAARPSITTASPLTSGEQGQAYAVSFAATGGTGALSFALGAGSLPAGLTLNAAGNLSGTPTVNGAFNFTVQVTDSLNVSNTAVFDLTIDPPATGAPNITTTSLTGGTLNQPYGPVNITATGGAGGYTFAVTGGSLPPGLTLSTGGQLSGTPTLNGTFPFDVTVTDAAFATDTQALSITIVVSSTNGGKKKSSDGGDGCAGGTGASHWLLLCALAGVVLLGLRRREA
ncbi:MAG: putative Ig domain-containing protein [Planctomycetes bacterium]|nr:putative Ig domain-containing protein [Planctomycetota bacterium]MCW8135901.1 putative Ig domain-containing protein [Planctomycetota bacterium]